MLSQCQQGGALYHFIGLHCIASYLLRLQCVLHYTAVHCNALSTGWCIVLHLLHCAVVMHWALQYANMHLIVLCSALSTGWCIVLHLITLNCTFALSIALRYNAPQCNVNWVVHRIVFHCIVLYPCTEYCSMLQCTSMYCAVVSHCQLGGALHLITLYSLLHCLLQYATLYLSFLQCSLNVNWLVHYMHLNVMCSALPMSTRWCIVGRRDTWGVYCQCFRTIQWADWQIRARGPNCSATVLGFSECKANTQAGDFAPMLPMLPWWSRS